MRAALCLLAYFLMVPVWFALESIEWWVSPKTERVSRAVDWWIDHLDVLTGYYVALDAERRYLASYRTMYEDRW